MYEDRPSVLTGMKLAVLSLIQHSPGLRIIAFAPGAPESFLTWAAGLPELEVRTSRDNIVGDGWGVKASVLLSVLSEGHSPVTWFDTDIIACGDVQARLDAIDAGAIVATQEYFWGHRQGDPQRTTGLGLTVGRIFPSTINTGLLRASSEHRDLLEDWAAILGGKQFRAAQKLSALERPLHYWGDQETLTGLLGSEQYAEVPVVQLKRGVEIAQCFGPSGFTVRERLQMGRRQPLLIHAMGAKPWSRRPPARSALSAQRIGGYVQSVHQELSPYVAAARAYRGVVQDDVGWMSASTLPARVLSRAFAGRPALQELPLAAVDSAQRWVRRSLGVGRIGSAAAPAPVADLPSMQA
jgi:hypothetical protein